jgi:hypothetical protein
MIKKVYMKNTSFICLFFLIFLINDTLIYAQGKKIIRKFNIRVQIEIVKEGNISYKSEERLYDANGNEIQFIKFNKDGGIKKKVISKYDKNNNLIEEQEYEGNQLVRKKIYTYNKYDEKISEITYDANNQIVRKEIFTYNDKGLKSEKKVYDKNDNLIQVHTYNYYTKSTNEK